MVRRCPPWFHLWLAAFSIFTRSDCNPFNSESETLRKIAFAGQGQVLIPVHPVATGPVSLDACVD